jgi:hypothetical protein
VLRAIREQILVPEHAMYVIRRALERARERGGRDGDAERRRLRELDTEVRNLIDLAARVGDLDEAAARIRELQRERETLRRRLRRSEPQIDVDELRAPIERAVRDLGAWLTGTPKQGRAALAALLGDRRLRVGPDAERGFRIDGELELALELRTARDPQDLRAVRFGGSGGALRHGRKGRRRGGTAVGRIGPRGEILVPATTYATGWLEGLRGPLMSSTPPESRVQ